MAKPIGITKTVWVVDDDPISRLLIKKTLERTGQFKLVREFVDGADFIKELANLKQPEWHEADLILLDINMPGKDGWEVLEFIKGNDFTFQKSKIVLLSSSINPKDKTRAFSYEAIKGYLQKPLATDDLKNLNL